MSSYFDLVLDALAPLSSESIVYGISVILTIMAAWTLCRKDLHIRANLHLLSTVLFIFLSSTGLHVARVIRFLAIAKLALNNNPDAQTVMDRTWVPIVLFSRVNFVLTDATVVWRAWVISPHHPSRIILAMCMCSTIVASILDGWLAIKVGWLSASPQRLVFMVPLLVTNLVSTLVVVYKTWLYRHHIKPYFRVQRRRTQVEKVLILFVESGFLYCGMWILTIVITLSQSVPPMALTILRNALPHIAAIYPTIIILVVANHKGVADSIGEIPTISQEFVQPQARTTMPSNRGSLVISAEDSSRNVESRIFGKQEHL